MSDKELKKALKNLDIPFKIPKDVAKIIKKYYPKDSEAYPYFFIHSVKVTELALNIYKHNKHLNLNKKFILKGAMLHDIGIIKTKAPEIGCHGKHPYIAHSYLGREILEKNGMPDIAPVCERHVGVGLSVKDIVKSKMPLPHHDMLPKSNEEKIICYADKFYSKSENHLLIPKPVEKIKRKVSKYGKDKLERFEEFVDLFGIDYVYEQ
jgi:uncharacterized protein